MTTVEKADVATFRLFVLFCIVSLLCLFGCGIEPSSTDHHNRVPQVNCAYVRADGHMEQECCQGELCWFTN
jgi:hypothetical protein